MFMNSVSNWRTIPGCGACDAVGCAGSGVSVLIVAPSTAESAATSSARPSRPARYSSRSRSNESCAFASACLAEMIRFRRSIESVNGSSRFLPVASRPNAVSSCALIAARVSARSPTFFTRFRRRLISDTVSIASAR